MPPPDSGETRDHLVERSAATSFRDSTPFELAENIELRDTSGYPGELGFTSLNVTPRSVEMDFRSLFVRSYIKISMLATARSSA